jgi:hypothetical protein
MNHLGITVKKITLAKTDTLVTAALVNPSGFLPRLATFSYIRVCAASSALRILGVTKIRSSRLVLLIV